MNDNFIKEINNLIDNDKYNEALELCKQELFIYTNKTLSKEEASFIAEIYYIIASIYAYNGNFQKALNYLESAIENNPDEISYYIYKAEIKIQIKDFEGAISTYTECINKRPTSNIYGTRGSLKLKLGEFESAIQDFTKAIDLDSNFAGGYIERGHAKYQQKDFLGAIADFTKAIELFPDYAYSYICRGNAKIKASDIDGAIEDFKTLKRLEPRNNIARKTLKKLENLNK